MILEYSDVLQTLTQVSLTLGGFIGVILVFQKGDRSNWNPGEKNSMFHLLYTSMGVFGLSLFPLLIQPGFSESVWVWRICCPLMGLAHVAGATRAFFENRRQEITIPLGPSSMFVFGSFLLFVLSLAVAFGFLLDFAALIYLVGLGWLLAVSVSAFVTLLFRGTQ